MRLSSCASRHHTRMRFVRRSSRCTDRFTVCDLRRGHGHGGRTVYRGKERGRGFNHAELLADAAVRELKRQRPEWRLCRAHGALSRVRETESQFGLTPHARRSNLRGAFAVRDADAVTGRDVLLIDDIYTTGATARVCSQVLRKAGARSVLVVTLARAQVETVALWDGEATSRSLPVEGFGQVVRETGGHR